MGNYNIAIIVMDTVRSSTFDKQFKEGSNKLARDKDFVYIKEAIAPASWTLPSHASIFTGLYPSQHGSHETKQIKGLDIDRIKLRKRTLLHDLKELGYQTHGVSANPYIHPIYGFEGFDHFREESYFTDVHGRVLEISSNLKPRVAKYRSKVIGENESNISVVFKLVKEVGKEDPALLLNMIASGAVLTPLAALKKLRAKYIQGWPIEKGGANIVKELSRTNFGKPFFLFVNLMEAHEPYVGKKELDFSWATPFLKEKPNMQMIEKSKKTYDYAVRKASDYAHSISRQLLDRFGEDTIIIITSDHGQEFGERGFVGHGTVLHDEVVKVPMLIRLPKKISRKLGKRVVSLTNIRKFIGAAIAGEDHPLVALYSKEAYSESFGVPANLRNIKGIDIKKLDSYEKKTRRKFG